MFTSYHTKSHQSQIHINTQQIAYNHMLFIKQQSTSNIKPQNQITSKHIKSHFKKQFTSNAITSHQTKSEHTNSQQSHNHTTSNRTQQIITPLIKPLQTEMYIESNQITAGNQAN